MSQCLLWEGGTKASPSDPVMMKTEQRRQSGAKISQPHTAKGLRLLCIFASSSHASKSSSPSQTRMLVQLGEQAVLCCEDEGGPQLQGWCLEKRNNRRLVKTPRCSSSSNTSNNGGTLGRATFTSGSLELSFDGWWSSPPPPPRGCVDRILLRESCDVCMCADTGRSPAPGAASPCSSSCGSGVNRFSCSGRVSGAAPAEQRKPRAL